MTSTLLKSHSSALQQHISMQQLGEAFIEALPKNISALKIPGRLITSDFRKQGNFIARASGMPEAPRVVLPHPSAGSGAENMKRVADRLVATLLRVFAGELKGEIDLSGAGS